MNNATIKINGIPIRKGYVAYYDNWYYGVGEYYTPFTTRRGDAVFASKTFTFVFPGNETKPRAYIALTRDGSVYPHKASKWRATIIIHGLIFTERDLSLSAGFTQVKTWMATLDKATD